MTKQQRNSTLDITLLVHEMHIHILEPINLNFCLEMIQFVQLRFLLAPIEAIAPVLSQPLDIRSIWLVNSVY